QVIERHLAIGVFNRADDVEPAIYCAGDRRVGREGGDQRREIEVVESGFDGDRAARSAQLDAGVNGLWLANDAGYEINVNATAGVGARRQAQLAGAAPVDRHVLALSGRFDL